MCSHSPAPPPPLCGLSLPSFPCLWDRRAYPARRWASGDRALLAIGRAWMMHRLINWQTYYFYSLGGPRFAWEVINFQRQTTLLFPCDSTTVWVIDFPLGEISLTPCLVSTKGKSIVLSVSVQGLGEREGTLKTYLMSWCSFINSRTWQSQWDVKEVNYKKKEAAKLMSAPFRGLHSKFTCVFWHLKNEDSTWDHKSQGTQATGWGLQPFRTTDSPGQKCPHLQWKTTNCSKRVPNEW